MIRLLLVQDEPQTQRALAISLRARGYEVDTAASEAEALGQALVETPDGVLLDLDVPGARGAELVRLLRPWTVGPILLLSAPGHEGDRAAALGAGADDFVTKPFGVTELLDRLRAALPEEAPGNRAGPAWLETPDFALDLAKRRAYSGGEEVLLSAAEWSLIDVLVRHRGGLVPEPQLLEQAGDPHTEDASNWLRRSMAGIRAKLEPDPARPRYFVCEPGLGWRFLTP
jgi:two-component system KDP operon response regulator KdpE